MSLRVLVPPSIEFPWHAGMGTRGHVCNYCLNWKPPQMSMSLAKTIRKNRKAAITRQQLIAADKFAASRALSFPSRMSVGGTHRGIIRYQQTHPGGEIKSADIVNSVGTAAAGTFTLNTTPNIVPLNVITIGSSMWNRVGRKISLKSLHMNLFPNQTGNAATVTNFGRILIVYDKQPNGALPNLNDVLQAQIPIAADTPVNGMFVGINLNNRDRFEIIRDIRLELPPPGVGTAAAPSANPTTTGDVRVISEFMKLGNRETHFKADSSPAVIGDIATGSLLLITVGNLAGGADPWSLTGSLRLRYSDL